MTLDQMQVLCTIIETGSFSAAAEELHRAQSAVSSAIKNLESDLGILIFNREGYRPKLTDEGEIIVRQVKRVLEQSAELSAVAEQLSMGQETEIRIAIDAICPLEPIKPIIRSFINEFPRTRLVLHIENLGGSIERLNQREADIAITEVFQWPAHIDAVPWEKIKFYPVIAPSHHLLEIGETISEQHLMDQIQIVVASSSQEQKDSINVLEGAAATWTVGDFSTKRELLISGFGWGFMPRHMVEEDLEEGRLIHFEMEGKAFKKLVPLQFDHPSSNLAEIFLLRRTDQPIGPIAKQLWNELQAFALHAAQ